MRLGGYLFEEFTDPESWIRALRRAGYRAAYCPVQPDADDATVRAYADAAAAADIVIAEVGAWLNNPISPDDAIRTESIANCQRCLDLADRIGARCCVNIAGSRGAKWDGPSPKDLTDETFHMIVEVVREIIDAVKPTRSFYALETMPWMYPNSPDAYQALLDAVDREGFAVHFDPVNLINSPPKYYQNAALIQEFIEKLGSRLRVCHAKDIILHDRLTVHLDEVRPGLGNLDFKTLLRSISALPDDVPVLLEHMDTEQEFIDAARYVRSVAAGEGLEI